MTLDNQELLIYTKIEDIPAESLEILNKRDGSYLSTDEDTVKNLASPFIRNIEHFCGDCLYPPSEKELSDYYLLSACYFETLKIAKILPEDYSEDTIRNKPEYKKYDLYNTYSGYVATNSELSKSINLIIESIRNEKTES